MTVNLSCGGSSGQPQLPTRVLEKLTEAYLRVQPFVSGSLWWETLSDDERLRLGGDLEAAWKNGRTCGMWMRLRSWFSQPRAIVEISRDLGMMSMLDYKVLDREILKVDPTLPPEPDPELEVQQARQTRRLVLVKDPHRCRAYWHGQPISVGWEHHGMSWDLLWALADAARRGGVVRWDNLLGCHGRKQAIHRKRNLKRLLPIELGELISALPHFDGGYEMDLCAEEIQLFDYSDEDALICAE